MSQTKLYNINDIKSYLESELSKHQIYLEAWKKVTRNRKKDGGDYKFIAKNFNGASIPAPSHFLTVYCYDAMGYYCGSESIYVDGDSIDTMFKKIDQHISDLQKIIEQEKIDLENCIEIVENTCIAIESVLDHTNTHSDTLKNSIANLISNEYQYYYYRQGE